MNTKSSAIALLLISGLSTELSAETLRKDIFSMSLEQLLSVKVTGAMRAEHEMREIPANVMIYERTQLDLFGYSDLSDLLQHIPGVDIIDNDHWFGEKLTIRGIQGNDRFLVLLNGRKLNVPSGFHLSIGNSISLKMASRVEIIYGPASVVYGSEAFAAVINIVTDESTEKSKHRIGGSYGSFNSFDAWFEGNWVADDGSWLKAYLRNYDSEGFKFDSDNFKETISRYSSPQRNQFEQPINDYNLLIEGQWKRLDFGYFRQRFDEGNARGLGLADGPGITVYNRENQWKFTTEKAWLSWSKESETGSEWKNDLEITHYFLDDNARFFEFEDTDLTATRSFFKTGIDKSIKLTSSYRFQKSDNWDVLLGAELERIQSLPPYANEIVFQDASVPYVGDYRRQMKAETLSYETKSAVFSEVYYQWNEALSFVVGLRFDNSSTRDESFNPRLAFIAKPNERSIFKFVYGTAFQSPSLDKINEQWGNAFIVMIPNTQQDEMLRNQKIETTEFIWQYAVSEDTHVTLSGYHHELTDLIGYNLFSSSEFNRYSNDFTPALRFENLGEQTVSGADIRLTGKASDNWIYSLSYSYLDTEEYNQPIVPTSKHKLNSDLTWSSGNHSVVLQSKWISKPFVLSGNVLFGEQKKANDYTLVNVIYSQKFDSSDWKFQLKVNNLFDENIFHATTDSGESDGRMSAVPQPGRNYLLSLEYSF